MSENGYMPVLRFMGFEGATEGTSYKEFLFDEIFQFSTGKNIKQNEASPEFETPCVRYGELYHMYNEVIYKIINRTNIDKSELRFSKGDEILLPSAGEDPLDIGSASALTLENIAIGRTINILRPINKNFYSTIYVSYYINQQLRNKIATLARGASISNVYNSDLKKLKINLPSLHEQQKIADFLSTVDKKIEALTRKKELLEEYKKGVMQKVFKQEIRFKQEGGSEFPEWEEKRLGDVTERVKRKNQENNQNILTISSKDGLVSQKEYFNKIVASKDVTNYYLLHRNDFAYNKSYSKGFPMGSFKRLTKYDKGVLSTLYICFKIVEGNSLSFFEYYFEAQLLNKELSKIAQEGVRNHGLLNMSIFDFFKIKITIPGIEEQNIIAIFLDNVDEKLNSIYTKLDMAQTWKKGLLQKMFV